MCQGGHYFVFAYLELPSNVTEILTIICISISLFYRRTRRDSYILLVFSFSEETPRNHFKHKQ